MNRTRNEIADYTWNPVTGCLKNCRYCYARRNILRFASDYRRNLTDERVRRVGDKLFELDEPWEARNERHLNTPTGFYPTLHRYRLDWPQKAKVGATIMVCPDGDLFGPWVPQSWISAVFNAAESAPQHRYLFVTYFPERYEQLLKERKLPARLNHWYGTTITKPSDKIVKLDGYRTFAEIEPIQATFSSIEAARLADFEWIVIGAETGRSTGKVIPKAEWIKSILECADANGVPVYMRSSMESIVGRENMREEKPKSITGQEPTEVQKARLWEYCKICERHRPMKEMYALLVRKHRGESPERIAYMCPECYEEFRNRLNKGGYTK